MWLVARYQPVGLFTLKTATATASGAKSVLVPTPFALKMALLDAACRLWGLDQAEEKWPELRDLAVAVRLPKHAVVTNLFAKILRSRRRPVGSGYADPGPLGKTIAFREYVWTGDDLAVALGDACDDRYADLSELLLQVNYLGKRGGFVQLLSPPTTIEELPTDFVHLTPPGGQGTFDSRGLMQLLDDCGPAMTFEQADIYSGKSVRLGKERVLNHVVLPYRLARSSRSYSHYERLDD